ncbi:hypothetical protein EC968_007667 [Mortierella alpina]|nr:hypothetical protein EC968_007667 [Mortierella alpina]
MAPRDSGGSEDDSSSSELNSQNDHQGSKNEGPEGSTSEDSGSAFNDTDSDEYYEEDKDAEEDEEDNAPDPLYVADLLRQLGVNWIHHPEYATHRLIIIKDPAIATNVSTQASTESAQCYRVMAQFLSPASAVFRDVLMAPRQCQGQDEDRLACVQVLSEREASAFKFPELPLVRRPLPPGLTLPPLIQVNDDPLKKSYNDALLPVLKVHLPHPEHFPALLEVMYDLDLDRWERLCFKPWTIAAIAHNVRRLECATDITLRCLEYYHRIKTDIPKRDQHATTSVENNDVEASMRELEELYRLAVDNGLLSTVEE